MKWLLTYLSSSIGKKQVMGATGCMLVLFVLGHMVGNLQLLLPDPAEAQAAYNIYSALLTKSKALLLVVEACLAAIVILHLYLAITLKLQNNKARGSVNYAVSARKGRKAFPTFVMIWTGLSIIAFLVWHIMTLRNGIHYYYISPEVMDGKVVRDMWLTTVEVLGNPLFAMFYITLMLLLGFHLWHAISSAFQTMGINHHKWTPIIDKAAIAYCVVVALGFGVTAAGCFAIVNFNGDAKAIIEQSKNPEYQKSLKALSERPVQEQKMLAKAIAKNPQKAKFMIERDNLMRGGEFGGPRIMIDGEKKPWKDHGKKFKHRKGNQDSDELDDSDEAAEKAEPQTEEGGEQ